MYCGGKKHVFFKLLFVADEWVFMVRANFETVRDLNCEYEKKLDQILTNMF